MSVLAGATAAVGAAAAAGSAVPKPHGWIGTVDDWARGLGIAFCLLTVVLLVVAWQRLRRTGLSGRIKELLVFPMVVLPLIVVFLGFSYGLGDPGSDTLAATHFKNRYIQEDWTARRGARPMSPSTSRSSKTRGC